VPGEAGEGVGLDARCTDGCDVREAAGAEVVDVEKALNKDELAPLGRGILLELVKTFLL
jgi:hypothetical protein